MTTRENLIRKKVTRVYQGLKGELPFGCFIATLDALTHQGNLPYDYYKMFAQERYTTDQVQDFLQAVNIPSSTYCSRRILGSMALNEGIIPAELAYTIGAVGSYFIRRRSNAGIVVLDFRKQHALGFNTHDKNMRIFDTSVTMAWDKPIQDKEVIERIGDILLKDGELILLNVTSEELTKLAVLQAMRSLHSSR